ncbi:aminoglycoside phosphotransferase family protein [Bacillus sp. FJAT-49736]|uniref:aminoglycoside phosphotransferase family protein n=1 Tax=Bacillus sp. FJAT-49736 TaxID=2833582 RepID=UPI001BC9F912|nr:aminoglycoside phosphotransferase family protein [Bacillus sp. FJAT-49736]MBS4175634.1 aminoglycoside phosphotransferase family protein [Bacillus sp. FJAT-49736]
MESILKELIKEKVIENKILDIRMLNGGTSSQVGLLIIEDGQRIVIKANKPQVIEAESYFLSFYQEIQMFPRLIYTDPAFNYILYTFITGEMNPGSYKNALKELVSTVINHYEPFSETHKWGYMDAPTDSWQNYLLSEAAFAKERLTSVLSKEDYLLVLSLIGKRSSNEPFLLHGDCGVHNFLFENGKLCGVIDPTPVIGAPIFDLVYAFCSTPNDLSKETIMEAAIALIFPVSENEVIENVIIGLYIRISRCIAHHPHDLPRYLQAWDEWKRIYFE